MRPVHERDIETYLAERVKALGGEIRKVKWIGRRGAPDRIVMLPENWGGKPCEAEFVWVELKAPGEKVKPHQAREHMRMRRMHQTVLVIDSFERIDEVLA